MAWSKMTDTEVALARKWYIENGERRASRSKFSLRAILDALRGRGIYFRPLCQKPTLTSDATLDAISEGGGQQRLTEEGRARAL